MARRFEEFQKRDVALLGLSVDSVYSHLAWIDSIKKTFDIEIPFPVIADLDLRIARSYGMVSHNPSTATVRSVFFIDPDLTVRATLAYPAAIGRNIDELLRVFDAFQENTVSGGCAIPANWRPGQPTLSPAPDSSDGLRRRWQDANRPGYKNWYYNVNE